MITTNMTCQPPLQGWRSLHYTLHRYSIDLHFQYSLYGTTVTKCLDKMCHFSYLLNINICSPACLTKNSLQPHLPSEIISLYCHPKSILCFTLSSGLFVITVRSTDRPGVASLPPHTAGCAPGPRWPRGVRTPRTPRTSHWRGRGPAPAGTCQSSSPPSAPRRRSSSPASPAPPSGVWTTRPGTSQAPCKQGQNILQLRNIGFWRF